MINTFVYFPNQPLCVEGVDFVDYSNRASSSISKLTP